MAFSKIVLAATTSAAASTGFFAKTPSKGQAITIEVMGLAGTETGTLQKLGGVSGSYTDVYVNGSIVQCTVSNNIISFNGQCGTYRINKSATAGSVGVYIESDMDIGLI